ncbi:oxygenase MpaB family protein [soil metagenome]
MIPALANFADEAVLLAGGGRAILLQLADPAIGRAIAEHSDFASDPLKRLRNTLTYIYALVYGTPEQVAAVRRMVHLAHAPVRSETYDASDARLQLWVAATLYDSAISLYERLVAPLEADQAELVYREYAVLGTALGMPRQLWPADRAAFAQYWEEKLATLAVDETTRAVGEQLLHPRTGPLWMRAAMPLLRLATAGQLSPALREAYRLDFDQHRYDRLMRLTGAIYPRLPRRLRRAPRVHYLNLLGEQP